MNDLQALPLFAAGGHQHERELAPGEGGDGLWLMVDPRRAGWAPGRDVTPFLLRAVELFRAKPWTGGAAPQVVRGHPEEVADGLGAAAAALGWQVVGDAKVARGQFWLGLKGGGER